MRDNIYFAEILEIVHHNRNKVELVLDNFSLESNTFNINEKRENVLSFFKKYELANKLLTPKDDTKITSESILKLINKDKLNSSEYIYSLADIKTSLESYVYNDKNLVIYNNSTYSWLKKRGVTEEQIYKYRLLDNEKIEDIKDRIHLGISIHPALQDWVGLEWANGITIPIKNLKGEYIGNYCRFLNTVPKIKFSASIPGCFLFTNLTLDSKPKNIYIVEGTFDALALETQLKEGDYFVCPSSGYFSAEQYIQFNYWVNNYFTEAKIIPLFDNDRVGTKSNIIFNLVFKDRAKIYSYPEDDDKIPKDMSEAIFKYKFELDDFKRIDVNTAFNKYRGFHYEQLISYDYYLDHRQAAYNNDNYAWI